MKRKMLLTALAAVVLFGTAAHAQLFIGLSKDPEPSAPQTAADDRQSAAAECTDASLDTLRRIDPSDSELVRLRETGEEGSMLLEIGGFGLTLGRSYEAKAWEDLKKRRFALTVASDIELGFTALTGIRYGHRAEGSADFLDQTLGSSFHFGFTPIGISMRVGKKNRSSFQLGMQYAVDNIRLINPSLTVRNDGPRLVPVVLDEPAKKSKLRYETLGIVLRYNWRPVEKLRIGLSTHCDFRMNAYAITKKPKEKTALSGLAPVRFGLGTSVNYRHVGFFVRYSPSSLFRPSSGLEAQTLSYGFNLSF